MLRYVIFWKGYYWGGASNWTRDPYQICFYESSLDAQQDIPHDAIGAEIRRVSMGDIFRRL